MGATVMRKSSAVPVTLLAALAAMSLGCRETPESRDCVDAQGRIVPDSYCATSGTNTGSGTGHGAPSGAGSALAGAAAYHYIYGGRSGGHMGDQVFGGGRTPSVGGVSRGGFGHGGGEGGE